MALTGDTDGVDGLCCSQMCSTVRSLNLEPGGLETNWRAQEARACEGGSRAKDTRGPVLWCLQGAWWACPAAA